MVTLIYFLEAVHCQHRRRRRVRLLRTGGGGTCSSWDRCDEVRVLACVSTWWMRIINQSSKGTKKAGGALLTPHARKERRSSRTNCPTNNWINKIQHIYSDLYILYIYTQRERDGRPEPNLLTCKYLSSKFCRPLKNKRERNLIRSILHPKS